MDTKGVQSWKRGEVPSPETQEPQPKQKKIGGSPFPSDLKISVAVANVRKKISGMKLHVSEQVKIVETRTNEFLKKIDLTWMKSEFKKAMQQAKEDVTTIREKVKVLHSGGKPAVPAEDLTENILSNTPENSGFSKENNLSEHEKSTNENLISSGEKSPAGIAGGKPTAKEKKVLVKALWNHLEKNSKLLKTEGIFRISPAALEEEEVKKELISACRKGKEIDLNDVDAHILASLIKKFCDEKIMSGNPEREKELLSAGESQDKEDQIKILKGWYGALGSEQQEYISTLCHMASAVAGHKDENKMNLKNMAMVLTPSITELNPAEIKKCNKSIEVLFECQGEIIGGPLKETKGPSAEDSEALKARKADFIDRFNIVGNMVAKKYLSEKPPVNVGLFQKLSAEESKTMKGLIEKIRKDRTAEHLTPEETTGILREFIYEYTSLEPTLSGQEKQNIQKVATWFSDILDQRD